MAMVSRLAGPVVHWACGKARKLNTKIESIVAGEDGDLVSFTNGTALLVGLVKAPSGRKVLYIRAPRPTARFLYWTSIAEMGAERGFETTTDVATYLYMNEAALDGPTRVHVADSEGENARDLYEDEALEIRAALEALAERVQQNGGRRG